VIVLLLLHLVVGVGVIAAGSRLGRRGALVGLVPPLATVIWLVTKLGSVDDGAAVTEYVNWIPDLGVAFDLRLDAFGALMVLLISGIGVLVFGFAAAYLPSTGEGVGRLTGLLVLFSGAMVGLVVSDNLLVLYLFWELTSVTSFLLIGNDHRRAEARAAALQALLVTGAGALAMLAGFLVLGLAAGTYQLSAIVADPPTGTMVGAALALILLGAFTKSAQYPFHSWLPAAMIAPTPVSAYLHAAAMVKAGIYLIARLSPAFAVDIDWWRPVVIGVGLLTMVAGGLRALRQHDLKLLLAFGTVSQLGLMVAVFGIGTADAMAAGAVLLLAHGAFKAANFMTVGIVEHQLGTRDLRLLPRIDRSWTQVWLIVVVGAGSMAALPVVFGFVAKEEALDAFVDAGGGAWTVAFAIAVAASALTVAYSARFGWGVLGRMSTGPVDTPPSSVRPSLTLTGPALVLTAVSLLLGIVPSLIDPLVTAADQALQPVPYEVHLAVWHGVNGALVGSVIATVVGAALCVRRRQVDRMLSFGSAAPDAEGVYVGALRGVNLLADRLTAVSQPGALPVYAGVILATAALLPLWALTTGEAWPGWPEIADDPVEVLIAAALVGAALAAALVHRRFSAALFLGVTGYAMAALFIVQGAPDLALTQVAIETLSTVLFVLVLRRLPDRFSGSPTRRAQVVRVAAALTVASSVFVLAMVMSVPDEPTPASDWMIANAEPAGHGRNIVNVILVDFRGFDTLGELSVLGAAAIGTVALARAGRRPGQPVPLAVAPDDGSSKPARLRRLVTLDVSVGVVFPAVMVGSIYLLFAGHNQPGGGFVGGILAGSAVALRYVAGGIESVRDLSRARPWTVLGCGLLLAAGVAITPLPFGDPVLSNAYGSVDVPLLGTLKVTSGIVFDLGVYLAVVGLALMMFESFGEDEA
jgi:multicomponent Na+:H+ antiporter subunit A